MQMFIYLGILGKPVFEMRMLVEKMNRGIEGSFGNGNGEHE